jgi:hypothetical protein
MGRGILSKDKLIEDLNEGEAFVVSDAITIALLRY